MKTKQKIVETLKRDFKTALANRDAKKQLSIRTMLWNHGIGLDVSFGCKITFLELL